jgi:hypothetical protein
MSASVDFVCIATKHAAAVKAKGGTPVSPITIHEGRWAYCPTGLTTDHEWRAIEPTSLEELMRTRHPAEKAPAD